MSFTPLAQIKLSKETVRELELELELWDRRYDDPPTILRSLLDIINYGVAPVAVITYPSAVASGREKPKSRVRGDVHIKEIDPGY